LVDRQEEGRDLEVVDYEVGNVEPVEFEGAGLIVIGADAAAQARVLLHEVRLARAAALVAAAVTGVAVAATRDRVVSATLGRFRRGDRSSGASGWSGRISR